jgi:transposase-like protein
MANRPYTDQTLKEAARAVAEAGTVSAAARRMGIPVNTLQSRWRAALIRGIVTGKPPRRPPPDITDEDAPQPKESLSRTETDTQTAITSVSATLRTLDDVLEATKVDLDVWEVERHVINKWDMGAKLGIRGEEAIAVTELWQVKIWLRRRAPKSLFDGVQLLLRRLEKEAPTFPRVHRPRRIADPHLLEVCLYDAHIGKLAWEAETGTSYDLKIGRQVVLGAVDRVLALVKPFPVERILLPLGQDFLHIDNARNTTVNDTQVDTDGRYPKIFESAVAICTEILGQLRTVAPVHVLWVPGNHDRTTSYHLVYALKCLFSGVHADVTFDVGPRVRKYHRYGVSLLGFTHGDEEKHASLPTVMADEAKADWAATEHHEWHLGHFHKRTKTPYRMDDSFGSVTVRTLPPLTGTDSWHYRKGYVRGQRAAEAYLWSKSTGYTGHFSANVPGR